MVVAPHPDDEVLGCGGVIANHRVAGRAVHLVYLTSGERGSPHHGPEELGRLREEEAVAAAGVLDVPKSELTFLRLPDGGIDPADREQVGQTVRLLRDVRPGLVYLPHPADGSFDHRAAFALCWRAARMAGSRNYPEWGTGPHWVPTILGYEVWSPIADPQYTEDITGVLDRKLQALSRYSSQTSATKGAGVADIVGASAAHLSGFRGATATGGHREAFQVLRLGRVIV
ncbi:MAG TPA: PIG-L deacetylase family protein [Mycobacteriales bacterium]|nr:PIG-L deacetylase family protein [Mycobacteriales bacterium]